MSTVRKPRSRSFHEMTDHEKRDAMAEFDQEFISDTFRGLAPEERADWERLQRRLKMTDSAPRYRTVKTRLSHKMISALDSLAKKRHISRSRLINLALGVFLARQREKRDG
jgi:hypothetical protein